jgi:hypothetical protein
MSLDPLLMQMISNKGNSENSNPLLSMLQNQDSLSPKTQMLLQLMSSYHPDNENDLDDVIEIEPDEILPDIDTQRLRRKIYFLQNELDEALEMIDILAEAIGACPDCFGGKDDCPECHGHGMAGWCKPDPKLFSHFIAPAIRRIKQHPYHAKKSTTPVRHDSDGAVTYPTSPIQKGDNDV